MALSINSINTSASGCSAGRYETELKEERRRNSAIFHISASSPPRPDCAKSGQRVFAWLFLGVIWCCCTSCGKKTGDSVDVLLQRAELFMGVIICLLIVPSVVMALLAIRIKKVRKRVNKQTPVVSQTDLSTSMFDEFHKSPLFAKIMSEDPYLTSSYREELDVWANKIHPDFNCKLRQKVPDIDPIGISMCQLRRLDIRVGITAKCVGRTSQDISIRTGNLCQKLNLKGDSSIALVEFLKNL